MSDQSDPAVFTCPHQWQGRALARAAAVVASGHTTAVLGALSAGVPALLFPNGSGTVDIAAMCRAAGTARVPGLVAPEELAATLTAVAADPDMARACAAVAAAFARHDGPSEVARELVALSGTTATSVRPN